MEGKKSEKKYFAIFKVTAKNRKDNWQTKISKSTFDTFLKADKVEFVRVKI